MDATPASVDGREQPPRAAQSLRGVMAGFAIDVALSLAIGFALMTLASLVWGVITGMRTALSGAGADAVGAAINAPAPLAQIALVMLASATTAVLLFAWRRPASAAERSLAHARLRQARTWWFAATAGVLVFAATTAVSWLMQHVGMPSNPANLAIIRAALAEGPLFVVFFTVVAAPLYEELLFRRVLFGRFLQAGWPRLGMVVSGLVFALSHEIPGFGAEPVLATLCLFMVYAGMGIVFAWLYRRTGTLWAPILAHALNNALALAFLFASVS